MIFLYTEFIHAPTRSKPCCLCFSDVLLLAAAEELAEGLSARSYFL